MYSWAVLQTSCKKFLVRVGSENWDLCQHPDDSDAQSGLETTRVEGALDWALKDPGMTPVHSPTQPLPLVLSVPV